MPQPAQFPQHVDPRPARAAMLRQLLVPPALCALAVSILAAALLLSGR